MPVEAKAAPLEHRPLTDPLAAAGTPEESTPSVKGGPHDPSEDYAFDSSSGKLYRLMEDTVIETVLVNRLAGAAPGPIICMVTTDVYSASGSHLLIPKGTRLLGRVSSVSSLNQERLFVAFHRAIMPDGYSVSLDKFQGLDVVGQSGLRDLVNHHYFQIFGASLALAAVGAVTQIGNTGSAYGSYDYGVSMRNGASQQLGQSAQRIMDRFLNVLPTFTIRERARVKIMLSGDLLLPDTKNHLMDPDL
jgi:type IV secretion system protein VirB10